MKKALEASIILSLSSLITAAVVVLVLPGHPAVADDNRSSASEVVPAAYVTGMEHRSALMGSAIECPFAGLAVDPIFPATTDSEPPPVCPFLAARDTGVSCPGLSGVGSAEECPYSSSRPRAETAPSIKCPGRDGAGPAAPGFAGGDDQLPLLAWSEDSSTVETTGRS